MPRYSLPASILVVLALAACGNSATPTSSAPAPKTTTTTAVTAEPAATTSTVAPPATEKPLTGTQYAYLKAIDPAKKTLTFDLVEWFEGDKAAAACKADGVVSEGEDDWCTGWYFRNNNKKLRTLPLASGAKLSVDDMSGPIKLVPATLPKFKAALDSTHHLFKFEVSGGAITKAEEVYTP